MRRTEPIRIGALVSEFLKDNPRLTQMLLESQAIEAWKNSVGPYVVSQTTRINIARGRMYVYITSAALRHEVYMRRSELIAQVNRIVGQPIVHAIYVK